MKFSEYPMEKSYSYTTVQLVAVAKIKCKFN
jgi:hypothetical protein